MILDENILTVKTPIESENGMIVTCPDDTQQGKHKLSAFLIPIQHFKTRNVVSNRDTCQS